MNKRQAKKRKKMESSYIRKSLLRTKTTEKGNLIYSIPASKVREKELQRMVRKANDRLRRLERAGLYEESREYRLVSHYAYSDPGGKGSIYNVNPEKDTIRFKSTLPTGQGYTREREYMINTLRNFLNASTSTVSGTRKAINKAFKSFIDNQDIKGEMTQDQYMQLWRTYHDMGLRDKLDNQGYNAFMTLVKSTDIYNMTPDEMKVALDYLAKSEAVSEAGKIDDVLTHLNEETNIKLAW
jgi:hypothetical protein